MNEKISEMQKLVLAYLVGIYSSSEPYCAYFRSIAAGTKLEVRQVRLACRALARKGLAEYVRGLVNDDGMMAGSGYCATQAGALLIEPELWGEK